MTITTGHHTFANNCEQLPPTITTPARSNAAAITNGTNVSVFTPLLDHPFSSGNNNSNYPLSCDTVHVELENGSVSYHNAHRYIDCPNETAMSMAYFTINQKNGKLDVAVLDNPRYNHEVAAA